NGVQARGVRSGVEGLRHYEGHLSSVGHREPGPGRVDGTAQVPTDQFEVVAFGVPLPKARAQEAAVARPSGGRTRIALGQSICGFRAAHPEPPADGCGDRRTGLPWNGHAAHGAAAARAARSTSSWSAIRRASARLSRLLLRSML